MKRIILGAALALMALACASHSDAQTNVCAGGAIPGLLIGGTPGACYYALVDSTGAIKVTESGGVAPSPSGVTITDRSKVLAASSSTLAAANTSRTTLSIQNVDTAVNECYSFTGAAVCGAASTYTLYPGQFAFWPAGSAPRTAVTVVAASGTPIISAYEGQ